MALLSLLRIAIGGHFLSYGLTKLVDGSGSVHHYLAGAEGPLAATFRSFQQTPWLLSATGVLAIWIPLAVGLALMLGLLTRTACVAGAIVLAVHGLIDPPGQWISPLLIEILALVGLATIPTGRVFGLDRMVARHGLATGDSSSRERSRPADSAQQAVEPGVVEREPGAPLADRRELLKGLSGVPFVVALGAVTGARKLWLSHEERDLVEAFGGADDAARSIGPPSLSELQDPVPSGTIAGKSISRLILGGNIACGFAHSRDLIYVSSLVRAYHTQEKIFETLMLAEKCGINTILTHPSLADTINQYWERCDGKIQFLADCGWMEGTDTLGAIDYAVDKGASLCYLQGEMADRLVREDNWDYLEQCLEKVRRAGLPIGIGAHRIETLRAIAEKGISPDFWMKTFHQDKYWSYRHPEERDNKYCYNLADTVAFMNQRDEPWIAFKVMAAGSLRPREAFHHAFENGADFICAGMYDFQIVEDSNITVESLAAAQQRTRRWTA
jgi:uncharacterized membrane protein YphA (DoxX/SURF4 family)